MRQEKLDPALQIAIQQPSARHLVFLQTAANLSDAAREHLVGLNVRAVTPSGGLYTARLLREEIDALSEQDWVQYLRLSQMLRPA